MPRINRSAVIEVSIPVRLRRGGGDDDEEHYTCFVCRDEFCDADRCGRSMTTTSCCSQSLCCACMSHLARRCTCTDDCEAVIVFCPFCREMVPLRALEVFLGGREPCKKCRESCCEATSEPDGRETPATRPEPQTVEAAA